MFESLEALPSPTSGALERERQLGPCFVALMLVRTFLGTLQDVIPYRLSKEAPELSADEDPGVT